MKYILALSFFVCLLPASSAQEITFANNIAETIYTHCSSCHREGEIAPFSLSNYDEVSNWAASIKYVTQNKIMPPWQPDPSYSTFLGENYLTDQQISDIASWADNGMPRGDVNEEPAFPDFPDGSVLGEPDLVLEMAEDYLHEGNGEDNYRYFVLPSGLLEDKIVKAMEFRPGNTKIVHHALVFEDLTGEAAENDAETEEYGFDGFGSFTDNMNSILDQKQYPGYVPGQKPIFYPDGTGQVLHAGADIVIQVHYAPWPMDEYDRSSLNIFFADETEEIDREVEGHIMVPFQSVIGEDFVIPPNQVKTFHGIYNVPIDVSILGLSPHMHLLGKHWEVYLEKTDGSIVNLIHMPEWDFNWQGAFFFDKYIVAEAGSKIHAIASYDNTENNPNNPSDPPVWVTWGEGTEDEMYYLPLHYVTYKEGDEDILFTSVEEIEFTKEDALNKFQISPNPSIDNTLLSFDLNKGETLWIEMYDMSGKKLRNIRKGEFFNAGIHNIWLQTKTLDRGSYLITIRGKNHNYSKTLIKQ